MTTIQVTLPCDLHLTSNRGVEFRATEARVKRWADQTSVEYWGWEGSAYEVATFLPGDDLPTHVGDHIAEARRAAARWTRVSPTTGDAIRSAWQSSPTKALHQLADVAFEVEQQLADVQALIVAIREESQR